MCGSVGVDLILGADRDVAVEINPRLTTSYVGLRVLAAENLAGEMIHIAAGGVRRPVMWHGGLIRFASDGTVVRPTLPPS